MAMAQPQPSLGLSITNPLVLYRALLATKKIRPDPAQHRLALQLQQLYFRLKDYDPDTEFRYRLDRAARLARKKSTSTQQQYGHHSDEARTAVFDDKGRGRARRWLHGTPSDALGLVRTIPVTDNALEIDSPQGMLLYGEVGRGKSMLLDLLYDSLPTKKKRRWHFNTFMLDIFRRLELSRIERLKDDGGGPLGALDHDHVVLALARETMETSPILFLDEFQLPDRVAGKLINGFLVSFFSLGGVLVASSNRMPEELAKAQGMQFRRLGSSMQGEGRLWWQLRGRRSEGEKAAASDFGVFVEVLKKRCEVWEMEGERDWRRDWESAGEVGQNDTAGVLAEEAEEVQEPFATATTLEADTESVRQIATTILTSFSLFTQISSAPTAKNSDLSDSSSSSTSSDTPLHYHVSTSASPSAAPPESYLDDLKKLNPSQQWIPRTLTVYARKIHLTHTSPPSSDSHSADSGVALLPFPTICATNLGPADYISICSSFHTLVITSIPVLTTLQKNEARRFITLLDACYEARCRLLIEAAAPPDRLFFPEIRRRRQGRNAIAAGSDSDDVDIDEHGGESDSIESEAFSEMYQESINPFRPNVSSYNDISARPTQSILSPDLRTVLADEDADFGPTYGNGRGHGASNSSISSPPAGFEELDRRQGPDFTQTGALTGADERFAYKRARSRLWEMCGRRWWAAREGRDPREWWVPVHRDGRFWESSSLANMEEGTSGSSPLVDRDVMNEVRRAAHHQASESVDKQTKTGIGRGVHTAAKNDHDGVDRTGPDGMFRHGASPFRVVAEPPPKFGWQHAWGMMTWGKKAGEWGKGVEGERVRREKEKNDEQKNEEQEAKKM